MWGLEDIANGVWRCIFVLAFEEQTGTHGFQICHGAARHQIGVWWHSMVVMKEGQYDLMTKGFYPRQPSGQGW